MKLKCKTQEQYGALNIVIGMTSGYNAGDHWEFANLDMINAVCAYDERVNHWVDDFDCDGIEQEQE